MNSPKQQPALDLNQPIQKEDRVGDYQFEPIKGYPMLNWRGKRPFTSTQYYPAQLKEVHGDEVDGWRNRIYWGDNLQVMSHLLKEFRGKVDLVYIDPPFDSKADYKKVVSLKGKDIENNSSIFEEKQYTDIWTNDEYLQFMYERIVMIREILKDSGTIYLHCDHHKIHYLRCIMDEIFGVNNFINEVIWCYKEREMSKTKWNTKHDNILFYAKNISNYEFYYEDVLEPYTDVTASKFKYQDQKGYYQIRGKGIPGSPVNKADGLNPEHEIKYPGLTYRQYMKDGTPPRDWWVIPIINKAANERSDYPTQKPEKLIEKIILASSKRGDIVLTVSWVPAQLKPSP